MDWRAEWWCRSETDRSAPIVEPHLADPGAARSAPPQENAGALHQIGIVGQLPPLDEAREESARERRVSADFGEARLCVDHRVWTIDVAFARSTGRAMHAPHRAHEIVQRFLAFRSTA